MTEDQARAALRALVAVGAGEPWIAQQAWEATPPGWTVPVPLNGWIFRLEPVPGGVRVIASVGSGGQPAMWAVPGGGGLPRRASLGRADGAAAGAAGALSVLATWRGPAEPRPPGVPATPQPVVTP